MKKKEGAFLGIGFWAGMALMSLINFVGSIFFVPNYYDMRYGLIMFIIFVVLVILGLIYLSKVNTNKRK